MPLSPESAHPSTGEYDDSRLLYFAYGSNMSYRRLAHRVPSARVVGPAVLNSHRLSFRKIGRDGSGKCDIAPAAQPSDCVHGVLFEMAPSELAALDAAEDLGRGYSRQTIEVSSIDRGRTKAFTYRALLVDDGLLPFSWYLRHVLQGATEHGLPESYIAIIAAVPSRADPDVHRQAREMALYNAYLQTRTE